MVETVLITGGYGFLGKAVARKFKARGCRVVGIGRGGWAADESMEHGFDAWFDADVSMSSLTRLNERFDLVVHCAGNGSVGYSLTNPLQDFHKTVQGSADLLEYLRLFNPQALLIYPSSAGVYGATADQPIRISDALNPISPYGYHKKMVEDLLASYSQTFGVRIAIIRFFSIYGPGLTKQLLWDASMKFLAAGDKPVVFWGTGQETRDWITSTDAANLIVAASRSTERFITVNGASGNRVTIESVLHVLKAALGVESRIEFNGVVRAGDPRFFHADIAEAKQLGWAPSVPLATGINEYLNWLLLHLEHGHG